MTTPKGIGCYRALLLRAKAGLSVDLIVPGRQLNKLGLTARYVEKLQAAGGRFFLVNLRAVNWQRLKLSSRDLLVVDGHTCWRPAPANDGWLATTDEPTVWKTQFQELREVGEIPGGTAVADWFTVPNLLQIGGRQLASLTITFRADRKMVKTGDLVKLEWSAPGAEAIEVQPELGQVPVSGRRSVRVTETTEFTLTARRGTATITKVLAVTIDRRAGLKYWLRAEDPIDTSRSFRLENKPDLPGHFGVLQGLRVTLHWETINARAVRLDGVPITVSGEHSFMPAGVKIVKLEVLGITGDTLDVPVLIKVFTPRVNLPDFAPSADFTPDSPQLKVDLEHPGPVLPSYQEIAADAPDKLHGKLSARGQAGREKIGVIGQLSKWFKNRKT